MNSVVCKQDVALWGAQRPDERNSVLKSSSGVINMTCHIEYRIIRCSCFEIENVTGERYQSMLLHYAFLRFWLLQEDYILSTAWFSFTFLKLSYILFEKQVSKQLDWEW